MIVEVNKNNKLEISGKELGDYEFISQLPSGANGMVYIVKNLNLEREEVLKVWTKLRKNDTRDKLKQAIKEVQKQAALSGNNYIAQIYTLDYINDIAYATMEYVKGITLNTFRDDCKEMAKKAENEQDLFNDIEISQMRTAMLKDYLSGLTDLEIRMNI